MRLVVLALLGAAICNPVFAADLPAAYSKAPAVAVSPAINWTGFYVGAVGGYASEASNATGLQGGFGGGTIGYNWQTGTLVLGAEADAAWGSIGQSVGIIGLLAVNDRIQDLGTVRGRIGVTFDQFLLYGTGGFAWADNRLRIIGPAATLSESQFHYGWVAGAGVEVLFAQHWSVKAEYLYREFGSQNYFASLAPPGIPTGTLKLHSGQLGVNFHF